MNTHNQPEEDEKPLDPAVENVQRKLKRFGGVFMGLNFLALIVVVGALIYKLGDFSSKSNAPSVNEVAVSPIGIPTSFDGEIDLPDGAKISSTSLSANTLILTLDMSDGSQSIWFYDLTRHQRIGVIELH